MDIEDGLLIAPDDRTGHPWFALDNAALSIRDAAGAVSVTGNLFLETEPSAGTMSLFVVCSQTGGRQDRLRMTMSLYDFANGEFEQIGEASICGSADRIARFAARLDWNDRRIGEQMDIRFRLAIHADTPLPESHYVFSIKSIRMSIQPGRSLPARAPAR